MPYFINLDCLQHSHKSFMTIMVPCKICRELIFWGYDYIPFVVFVVVKIKVDAFTSDSKSKVTL